MLRLLRLAAVGVVMAALLPALGSAQERRIALVVGNAAYREAPLRNPVNDARAMAAALKRAGFEVMLHENVGKARFSEAVGLFGEKLTEGATGLFYFAGHGMQVQGRNYLIPVDASITSEQRVRLETMDVEAVLDQMQAARTRVSMVILDACRNNPFERRFRSGGGGLAQINAPTGTLIAYATAPGKVAADGDGANGIYTQELLKALDRPGLKVEDVFKQVRVNVMRLTGESQVPWETSSLTGDFMFVSGTAMAAQQPATLSGQTDPAAIELAFWQSVANSQRAEELQAYLARYPNGVFADLARTRIAGLGSTVRTPAAAVTAPPAAPTPEPSKPAVTAALTPPPVASGGTALSGEDLRREIFGGTFSGRSLSAGRPFLLEVEPSGVTRLENGRSQGIISWNDFERNVQNAPKYDQGRFRIDGDKLCSKWQKLRGGAETCMDARRDADGTISLATSDGQLQFTLRRLR